MILLVFYFTLFSVSILSCRDDGLLVHQSETVQVNPEQPDVIKEEGDQRTIWI